MKNMKKAIAALAAGVMALYHRGVRWRQWQQHR